MDTDFYFYTVTTGGNGDYSSCIIRGAIGSIGALYVGLSDNTMKEVSKEFEDMDAFVCYKKHIFSTVNDINNAIDLANSILKDVDYDIQKKVCTEIVIPSDFKGASVTFKNITERKV